MQAQKSSSGTSWRYEARQSAECDLNQEKVNAISLICGTTAAAKRLAALSRLTRRDQSVVVHFAVVNRTSHNLWLTARQSVQAFTPYDSNPSSQTSCREALPWKHWGAAAWKWPRAAVLLVVARYLCQDLLIRSCWHLQVEHLVSCTTISH